MTTEIARSWIPIVRQVARYLRYNPVVALKVAAYLARGQIAIPLDLMRWLVLRPSLTLPETIGKLERLILTGREPWLTMDAWLTLVGENPIRLGFSVRITTLDIRPGRFKVTVAFRNVELESLKPQSPFGKLLSADIFDLSRPVSLLRFMPERPTWIVGGCGNELTFDLMNHPALGPGTTLRRRVNRWSALMRPVQAETRRDWLVVDLEAF